MGARLVGLVRLQQTPQLLGLLVGQVVLLDRAAEGDDGGGRVRALGVLIRQTEMRKRGRAIITKKNHLEAVRLEPRLNLGNLLGVEGLLGGDKLFGGHFSRWWWWRLGGLGLPFFWCGRREKTRETRENENRKRGRQKVNKIRRNEERRQQKVRDERER